MAKKRVKKQHIMRYVVQVNDDVRKKASDSEQAIAMLRRHMLCDPDYLRQQIKENGGVSVSNGIVTGHILPIEAS